MVGRIQYSLDRQIFMVRANYGKNAAQLRLNLQRIVLADQLLHGLVRQEKGRKNPVF